MVPVKIFAPLWKNNSSDARPWIFHDKCLGKIQILLLKVQQCLDFSILQTIYPYVASCICAECPLGGLENLRFKDVNDELFNGLRMKTPTKNRLLYQ